MWKELRWITRLARQVWGGLTRGNKLGLAGAMALMPLAGFLTNVPAIMLGRLVDRMLTAGAGNVRTATPYLAWIAAALLAREGLAILRKYLVENTATSVYKAKTVQAVAHLLRLDLQAFGPEQRVGGVQGRMQRSLEGFVKLIKLCFLDLLPAIVTAICALAVVALRNPGLMGLMAAVIPVGLVIALLQVKAQKGIRIALLRAKEDIDGRVVELLGGLEYIRAADTESLEIRKVESASEKLRQREIQHHIWMSVYDAAKALNEGFFHILVLFATIYLAYKGRASAGDVLALSVLFTAVVNPLREIHRILDEAHESGLRASDLFELLDQEEDVSYRIRGAERKRFETTDDPHLELTALGYRYAGRGAGAVNDINLQIRRGEVVGIVGPSGSGKSTLIKLLLGLLHPQAGEIRVKGRRLDDMTRAEIAQEFGYVSQTPFLFAGTIKENIAYGCGDVSDGQIREAARKAQMEDEIARMPGQYAAMVSERGGNLSGGQRQRVALARLLLKNPGVVILDEATGALDTINEKRVQAALAEALRGRTMIIVAHRLSTLADADRIAVLSDGQIVEAGTFEELLACGGAFAALNRASGVPGTKQPEAAVSCP